MVSKVKIKKKYFFQTTGKLKTERVSSNINQIQMRKLKMLKLLSGCFFVLLSVSCNNNNNNNATPKDCGTRIDATPGSNCGISEFRLETPTSFPNPVRNGGTAKIRAVVAAINQNFQPIQIQITIKFFSVSGQLINTSTHAPQQTLIAQEIPIWQNINAGAGQYYAEIVINKGACGSEKICINGITVV